MKKYSKEWKELVKRWVQKHGNFWKIHYIQYDTEYSKGHYPTRKAALNAIESGE